MYFTEQITEIEEHVMYPLSNQLVNKFIANLGIEDIFDNNIYINSNSRAASVDTASDSNRPKTKYTNRFDCDIRTVMNPNNIRWDAGLRRKNFSGSNMYQRDREREYSIFNDDTYGLILREYTVPANIIATCKMSFKNRADADVTLGKIYERYVGDNMLMFSDFVYDYRLPDTTLGIMFLMYKMMKKEPNKFLHYLRQNSKNAISLNINRDLRENDNELIIQKNMTQVGIYIEFTQDESESEVVEKSPDLFTISFNLIMQFSRPDMVTFTYPVIVNNEYVPPIAIPVKKYSNLPFIQPDRSIISFDHIAKKHTCGSIERPIIIPWYDDWRPPNDSITSMENFSPFLITTFTLDKDFTKINLEEPIAGIKLKDEVLHELRKARNKILWTSGEFNVSIYCNDYLYEPSHIRITNGTEITLFNKDITKNYHLVISERRTRKPAIPRCWIIDADIICKTSNQGV